MSLSEDVANFLQSTDALVSRGIGQLSFTFDGFRVDPAGFREIGQKVAGGQIQVAEASSSDDSSVAAVYTHQLDKFSVPADLDLGNQHVQSQAMIIHEATHALIDMRKFACTNEVNEAIAYVAGQAYALTRGSRGRSSDQAAQAIIAAAQNVVMSRDMVNRPGQQLRSRDADIVTLRSAITAHTAAYPDAHVRVEHEGLTRHTAAR